MPGLGAAELIDQAGVVVDGVRDVAAVDHHVMLGGPVADLAVDPAEVVDALDVVQEAPVPGHGVLPRVMRELIDSGIDLANDIPVLWCVQIRVVPEERLM